MYQNLLLPITYVYMHDVKKYYQTVSLGIQETFIIPAPGGISADCIAERGGEGDSTSESLVSF